MVDSVIPLRNLLPGQVAEIFRIDGQPECVHRLEEFGLRRGTQIEMFRRGNPCIIRTAGNKVCLRVERFFDVFVRPTAGQR
ncbi:MAG: ferrous iron transport protein A [Pirellulales bacterium]|nr:ferrous iron transport protein A [Pirellulales bacterium]